MDLFRPDLANREVLPADRKIVLPGAFSQVVQYELYDGLQRLEDPYPGLCACLELGNISRVQQGAHFFNGSYVGKITLVVLHDQGYLFHAVPLILEIHPQVFERLDVGIHPGNLRIGTKDHTIHPAQNQAAAGIVENLARHGIEMEAGLEAPDFPKRQRKKIEKQCALRLSRKGNHLSPRVGVHTFVDVLKVVCLPAETRSVIYDLAVNFF